MLKFFIEDTGIGIHEDSQQAQDLLNQFHESKINNVLSKTEVISDFAQNKAQELFSNVYHKFKSI